MQKPVEMISIRGIDPDLYKVLRHWAIDEGVPVGQIINRLLSEEQARLARIPKPIDVYPSPTAAVIEGGYP